MSPSINPEARSLVAPDPSAGRRRAEGEPAGSGQGFGRTAPGSTQERASKGRRKRGSGLSAADRLPLGRSPDLEAMQARQRLGLPLSGRLREADVTRAWKAEAGEHHPDRGGHHHTMAAINGARDLLLGRHEEIETDGGTGTTGR